VVFVVIIHRAQNIKSYFFHHLKAEVLFSHFPEVLPNCFRCQRGICVQKWRRLVALPSSNNKTYPPHQDPTPVPSRLCNHPPTPAALQLVGSRRASGNQRSLLIFPLRSSALAAAAPARAALARLLPPAGAVVRAPLPTPVVPVLEAVVVGRVGLSGSCLRPAGMGTCPG